MLLKNVIELINKCLTQTFVTTNVFNKLIAMGTDAYDNGLTNLGLESHQPSPHYVFVCSRDKQGGRLINYVFCITNERETAEKENTL